LGYRRAEGNEEEGKTLTFKKKTEGDEPELVPLFGERPLTSWKIGNFIKDEYSYYIDIYLNNKKYGLPYPDWTHAPQWVIDLDRLFSRVDAEYEAWSMNQK